MKLSFKYHLCKPHKWRLIYWRKRLLFTIFCGFRKVRFQRYSPHFRWNKAVLLLKQWSRPPLTSLKLSFKYHLWKPQNWRLISWSKRPLFTIFCGFRKVRFQRYSPQFRWNQAVLLLKQWSRLPLTSLKLSFKYLLWKPQKWRLIYWSKRPLFTIFCGFRKVRFHRYSPHFRWNKAVLLLKQWPRPPLTSLKLSFNYHLWKPQKWRLISWSKRPLFTIFCGFRKVRFQRYSPQFRWNQAVLLLKQWSRLPLTSLKLSFKYQLRKPQKWRLIYWRKRLLFTIFCGFRKVRFQRYSPQFRWNQAVLLLKQWSRPPLTSFKLSFKYHLWKPQKWRFIYWSKRPLFTIFCGFRKVRFQRYSPQFRSNQAVLLLKQWSRLSLTSLKISFKYHLCKPQKWRLIYWSKRPLFTIFCGSCKVCFQR